MQEKRAMGFGRLIDVLRGQKDELSASNVVLQMKLEHANSLLMQKDLERERRHSKRSTARESLHDNAGGEDKDVHARGGEGVGDSAPRQDVARSFGVDADRDIGPASDPGFAPGTGGERLTLDTSTEGPPMLTPRGGDEQPSFFSKQNNSSTRSGAMSPTVRVFPNLSAQCALVITVVGCAAGGCIHALECKPALRPAAPSFTGVV